MSITYDPMTGEPIETPDEQPVNNNAGQIVGYDPETGAPIYEQAQPTGYDPETGAPVYEQAQPTGYDPINGTPVYDNGPAFAKPKGKFPVWIFAAAAAVLVVVGGVAALAASGVFGGTNNKILTAFANTFKSGELTETLNFGSLVEDGEYTIDLGVTVEDFVDYYGDDYSGISGQMALAADVNNGKYGATGSFSYPDYDLDLTAEFFMDQKEIAFAVPEISETAFIYNFTEEKDGFLVDEVDDEVVEQIDALLQWVTTQNNIKDQKKMQEDMLKALHNCFKEWEFKSAKSAEYEVDGKKRSCKAYTVIVDEDKMIDLVEAYETVFEEYYADQMTQMEELMEILGEDYYMDTEDMDVSAMFKELKHGLKDMPDMETTIYLYKKQVAAILVEADDEDVSLEFNAKGGDYPMQNWSLIVSVDREEVEIAKNATRKGSVENSEIEIDGVSGLTLEWSYDSKSGDLSGEFSAEEEGLEFEGNLKNGGNEFALTLDTFTITSYDDEVEFSGYLNISDKAKIDKPAYEEFDLGNATEDECEDMFEDIAEELQDMMY